MNKPIHELLQPQKNVELLKDEYDSLRQVIKLRQGLETKEVIPEHSYMQNESGYRSLIERYKLTPPEQLILLLALAPELNPGFLNDCFTGQEDQWQYVHGGVGLEGSGEFIPTVQTALFVLGGSAPGARFEYHCYFDEQHRLYKLGILELSSHRMGNKRTILASTETLYFICTGKEREPDLNPDFPANRLETKLEWDDLILSPETEENLMDIQRWLEHNQELHANWGLEKVLNPGYRCLFHGPPGTGKTVVVALLGKVSGRPVYRINLSRLVSKYIGETEKNLEKIFNRAETKDWILFFDEADAIFGKRTQVTTSNDRYANQEISYLLQRIESCPNPVIMASNLKTNIDDAFMRRFHSTVEFFNPSIQNRERIWKRSFSNRCTPGEDVDIRLLSSKYDLTGADLAHIVRYVTLLLIRDGRTVYTQADLLGGLKQELRKIGRRI